MPEPDKMIGNAARILKRERASSWVFLLCQAPKTAAHHAAVFAAQRDVCALVRKG